MIMAETDTYLDTYLCERDEKGVELEIEEHEKINFTLVNKKVFKNESKLDKYGTSYIVNMAINNCGLVGISTNLNQNAILDQETLTIVKQFNDRTSKQDTITALKFGCSSPHLVFTSSTDNTVRCYDLRESHTTSVNIQSCTTYKACKFNTKQKIPLLCVDVNISDTLICAGSEVIDDNVYTFFWDTRKTNALGAYWDSHTGDITQVKFSEEKQDLLLTGSADGLVNLFDVNESSEDDALQQTYNTNSFVDKLNWIGAEQFICLTSDGQLQFWTADQAGPMFTNSRSHVNQAFKGCSSVQQLISAYKSYDSTALLLFSANSMGVVHLSKISSDGQVKPINILQGHHESLVRCCVLNQSNGHVFTSGEDGVLCQWKPS